MHWLNRAEVRLGFLALPGLPSLLCVLNALAWALAQFNPPFFALLELDGPAIRAGEVWRVVTFLFIPRPIGWLPGALGLFLYLMFIYFIGTRLERAMGAFRLTLYYGLGMIGLAAAAVIFEGREGGAASAHFSNALLNTSLLFAFVRYYPDAVFLVFFVLPIKAVWSAWVSAAFLLYTFIIEDWALRCSLLVALGNYLLFFGGEIFTSAVERNRQASRKDEFDRQIRETAEVPLHQCAVCGRTEAEPDLEFRVARDGEEYCVPHLPKPAAN